MTVKPIVLDLAVVLSLMPIACPLPQSMYFATDNIDALKWSAWRLVLIQKGTKSLYYTTR